jgi:putative ABC transport system permease protein
MNIWRLILQEILGRKQNFISGLISVILATAVLTGALTSLKLYDIRTRQIIDEKIKETEQRMALLQDDYRKIMKKLGFNLLILPREQQVSNLYLEDLPSHTMPESYVDTLATSDMMSIRHLLPSLQQKLFWPEQKRSIILIGTRGEVPLLHRDPKEPILVAVPRGEAVIGHHLAQSLQLKPGTRIQLLGQSFLVNKCNEERGSRDDITIWIDLKQAQEMLNKPDQVNAILALKCHCAGSEIAEIRQQVQGILPGVKVIEQGSKVVTRAEARDRAAREAREAITAEKLNRASIRKQQQDLFAILVPVVFIGSAIWIALLFLANVRERKSEIGIFTAIGVKSQKIIFLFIGKAMLMGAAGALAGYLLGVLIPSILQESLVSPAWNMNHFVLSFFLALILAGVASWIPAYLASQQDPAAVLREE